MRDYEGPKKNEPQEKRAPSINDLTPEEYKKVFADADVLQEQLSGMFGAQYGQGEGGDSKYDVQRTLDPENPKHYDMDSRLAGALLPKKGHGSKLSKKEKKNENLLQERAKEDAHRDIRHERILLARQIDSGIIKFDADAIAPSFNKVLAYKPFVMYYDLVLFDCAKKYKPDDKDPDEQAKLNYKARAKIIAGAGLAATNRRRYLENVYNVYMNKTAAERAVAEFHARAGKRSVKDEYSRLKLAEMERIKELLELNFEQKIQLFENTGGEAKSASNIEEMRIMEIFIDIVYKGLQAGKDEQAVRDDLRAFIEGYMTENEPLQNEQEQNEQKDNARDDHINQQDGDPGKNMEEPRGPVGAPRPQSSRAERRKARAETLKELPSREEVFALSKISNAFSSGAKAYNEEAWVLARQVGDLRNYVEMLYKWGGNQPDGTSISALMISAIADIQKQIDTMLDSKYCSRSKSDFLKDLSLVAGANTFEFHKNRIEILHKQSQMAAGLKTSEELLKADSANDVRKEWETNLKDQSTYQQKTFPILDEGRLNELLTSGVVGNLFKNTLNYQKQFVSLTCGDRAGFAASYKNAMLLYNKLEEETEAITNALLPGAKSYTTFMDSFINKFKDGNSPADVAAKKATDRVSEASAYVSNYFIGLVEAKLFFNKLYDDLMFGSDANWENVTGKTFVELISSVRMLRADEMQANFLGKGGVNTVQQMKENGERRVLKAGKRDIHFDLSAPQSSMNLELMLYNQRLKVGGEYDQNWQVSEEHIEYLRKQQNLVRESKAYRSIGQKSGKSKLTKEQEYAQAKYNNLENQIRNLSALLKAKKESADGNAPMYVLRGANTSKREVAVTRVAKLLNFDISSDSKFALMESGGMGVSMGFAGGKEASQSLMYSSEEDSDVAEEKIKENFLRGKNKQGQKDVLRYLEKSTNVLNVSDPKLQKEFIKLAVLDIIVGSADRHISNLHIAKSGKGAERQYKLTAIDNDIAFRVDSDYLNQEGNYENPNGIGVTIARSLPYITSDIAQAVMALDEGSLRAALTGMIQQQAIDAAATRLNMLKSKLNFGKEKKAGMVNVVEIVGPEEIKAFVENLGNAVDQEDLGFQYSKTGSMPGLIAAHTKSSLSQNKGVSKMMGKEAYDRWYEEWGKRKICKKYAL